jgi:hypothetical protein
MAWQARALRRLLSVENSETTRPVPVCQITELPPHATAPILGRSKSLRATVSLLLGTGHSSARMSYDLRRLRLKGLIERIPGSNAYRITDTGLRFAVFYTKLHDHLLTPLMAANRPPAPTDVRQALATLQRHTDRSIDLARLTPAA